MTLDELIVLLGQNGSTMQPGMLPAMPPGAAPMAPPPAEPQASPAPMAQGQTPAWYAALTGALDPTARFQQAPASGWGQAASALSLLGGALSNAGNPAVVGRQKGIGGAARALSGGIAAAQQQNTQGFLQQQQLGDWMDQRERGNRTREWLRKNADKFGMSPEMIDALPPQEAAKLYWQEQMKQRERDAAGRSWQQSNPPEDWEGGDSGGTAPSRGPTAAPEGGDPYQTKTGQQESGGDYTAVNPHTGAYGKYQFLPSTAKTVAAANPQLRLPGDVTKWTPQQQDAAEQALRGMNAAQLKATLGRDPSPSDLRLAHYFGPAGAARLLKLDPNTPFDKVPDGALGTSTAEVLRVNPNLRGMRVGDLIGQYRKQFDGTATVQPTASPTTGIAQGDAVPGGTWPQQPQTGPGAIAAPPQAQTAEYRPERDGPAVAQTLPYSPTQGDAGVQLLGAEPPPFQGFQPGPQRSAPQQQRLTPADIIGQPGDVAPEAQPGQAQAPAVPQAAPAASPAADQPPVQRRGLDMPPEVQQQIGQYEKSAQMLMQSARSNAAAGRTKEADELAQRARAARDKAADLRARFAEKQLDAGRDRFQAQTLDDGIWLVDMNNGQKVQRIGDRPTAREDQGREFKRAKDLRGEFAQATKDFNDRQTAYGAMIELAKQNEGASDLALVFSLMKVYDPTSTVTAGEAANAQNAAGVPERIKAMYNKLIGEGGQLTESQRLDLVNAGRQRFEQEHKTFGRVHDRYADLAKQYGIDPREVVYEQREPSVAPERGAKQMEMWRRIRQMDETSFMQQFGGFTADQFKALDRDEQDEVVRRLERIRKRSAK